MPPKHFFTSVRDRLARSRFFTISLTLHVVLIAVFGTKVLIDQTKAPEEPVMTFLPGEVPSSPPKPRDSTIVTPQISNPGNPGSLADGPSALDSVIRSINPTGQDLSPVVINPVVKPPGMNPVPSALLTGPGNVLSPEEWKRLKTFADWREPGRGDMAFTFTAFLGQYRGGNWNSTVRVKNGEITGGSLPNLLYAMSKWSKNRIRTNEREVKALPLDSPELLTSRPPFIFLTGTRDFRLTDREVENLRNYLQHGGAVWGDSSVPGHRSAFDIAFRREMKRVVGGVDTEFETLPANHEVFTNGYHRQIRELPEGVNHYRESVRVLRMFGEIAVIQTVNDYGDMWQVGLDKDGQIDTSRNKDGEYVALNAALWNHRGIYVRNLEQPAVEQAYQFGINMIMHLLTRWEGRLSAPTAL